MVADYEPKGQKLRREIKIMNDDTLSDYIRDLTNDANFEYLLWKAIGAIETYNSNSTN